MNQQPNTFRFRFILFALTGILLFFGLCEGFLRIAGYQPTIRYRTFKLPYWMGRMDPVTLQAYRNHLDHLGFVNEDLYAYRPDPVLGYRLRPGLHLTVRNYSAAYLVDSMPEWTIISNDAGFRAGNMEKTDFSETSRTTLHVLGDSSSFGWGVDYEESYGFLLRDRLNREIPEGSGKFGLINHSLPGFSSFQGKLLLSRLEDIHPGDWVFISFGWNDSYPAANTDQERFRRKRSSAERLQGHLENLLLYKLLKSFLLSYTDNPAEEPEDTVNRVPREEYKENLKGLFESVRKKGGRPVFISICNLDEYAFAAESVTRLQRVPFFDFPDQFGPHLSSVPDRFPDRFMTYYDSYGELMEEDENYVVLFPDGCHPNTIGHRLISEILFDVLKSEFGLVSESGRKES